MRIVSCECTDAKTWSQREDTFGKKQDVDDISEMFEGDLLNRSGDLYSGFEVGVNRRGPKLPSPPPTGGWASAIQALNHVLPVSDHVPIPVPPTLRQRQLSEALDKVVIAKLAAPVPGYLAPCVMAWRIASATMPGSRARVAVIAPSDTTPFEPSLQLVPKRPAFTPRSRSQPRPEDGGASEDGARATNGRRPADVWVGNCGLLGPAAFDLAVTSGLRSGHLPSTVADGRRAVSDYEGLQFLPLVAEACSGGWGPTALKTWKELSVALAARNNEAASVEHDRLLQSLAVALQRENARAALRRIE
ncbi:E3 ubiquitin ligase (RING-type E3 ubiquitin transferase) (Serine/threonine-protein kinase) [Durusdinium trenchii]|uniref:E3 ubiquitin ligase (RING-type E3 ubiquitin transferase) (Serine/threonine-protein kinase) n=1 Tax=Durusdinium trenchii TaxID=1381693 RepID=A0ABP0QT00_9DINO